MSSTFSQTHSWTLTTKPNFQTELLAAQDSHLLEEKINLLAYDPYPDGRIKKALPGSNEQLSLLVVGNYFVFYTIQRPYVSLLALRPRRAFTSPDGLPSPEEVSQLLGKTHTPFWERVQPSQTTTPPKQQALPRLLTTDFLHSLRVSSQYHPLLLRVRTRQALLNCPGVPPESLRRIDNSLFEQPLAQVLQEPTYVLSRASDLQRYKDGDLQTFLLLMAPEQEKAVTWASTASGPVQVKGKPGTGKSTVALYRIRSFIQKQQEAGQPAPRVLFTTYTNTLIKSSEQLLEQLLETQINCVTISTADSLITKLFGGKLREPSDETLSTLLSAALHQAIPEEARQREFLSKHSREYLLEEIKQFIIARKILTESSYLALVRTGRKVGLREPERKIIWQIYELLSESLRKHHLETWTQWRIRAEDHLSQQTSTPSYDAVFVDEAQDLEPSVLRILLKLCKNPSRFFITADVNQSIYNKGFSWVSVHEDLRFQGRRTITLKTNYRSTRQIGEAAESYLQADGDETDKDEWSHTNTGPLPAVRTTSDFTQEVQTLTAFLNEATKSLYMGLQSCAILCPTKWGGQLLVEELHKQGIEATFQTKRELGLATPGVKVLTIHGSKGLEFPIVALAGFRQSPYMQAWEDLSDEERREKLAQTRKLFFVGMTRAMKALLVLVPAEARSALFSGFDPDYWDMA